MNGAGPRVSAEIRRLSESMARRAADLAEYADALATDPAIDHQLADEYAAAPVVVQIMGHVDTVTRAPDLDTFRRTLLGLLATAQRSA